MTKNEADARRMAEQLKKLPEDVQERVGYIIQGALLMAHQRPVLKNCDATPHEQAKSPA